jgi:hypothetical protein
VSGLVQSGKRVPTLSIASKVLKIEFSTNTSYYGMKRPALSITL